MKQTSKLIALAALGLATALPMAAAQTDAAGSETAQTASLISYQKVYVAPVEVSLDPVKFNLNGSRGRGRNNTAQRPVSDADQDLKARDLRQTLSRTLAKDFELVDAPSPDALTVSARITKLVPSRPTGREQSRAIATQFGGSVSPGGANYTVEFSNQDTSLHTLQENYRGNLTDAIPRIAIWHDVDESFSRFSKKLRRYVKNN